MMNLYRGAYVVDANILISAYRDQYPPDLFPGFWDFMAHQVAEGRVLIIDRVRAEITSPTELVQWVDKASSGAFVSTVSQPVAATYGEMAEWIQENPQFLPAAVEEFARGADGWLAAFALVTAAVVVTNEVFLPDVRRRVPLPNLCQQFNIRHCNMIEMLRGLDTKFDWRRP